jgi:hypothetical protein
MRQSREPTTARRALGAHQSPVLGSEAPERPDTPGRPDADVGAYNAFPWAAGVFDACGTITRCRSRLRLAFNTTDEQAVRRFHEAVGVGKVYGPYANSGHDTSPRQPFFIWLVEGAPAGTLAQRLRPWLSPTRRDRLDEVIG